MSIIHRTRPNLSGCETDIQLVQIWLQNQLSAHTRRTYAHDATRLSNFLRAEQRTLRALDLVTLTRFLDGLDGADTTRARRIAVIKSLLSFAEKTGYLQYNVGAAIPNRRPPHDPLKRSMTRDDVQATIGACRTQRERLLIRTFYASGLRLTELVSLRWSDLRDGVITVIGKGQKLRRVPLLESVARDLEVQRSCDDAPIFLSRTGKALTPSGMWRRVKVIAARAGIRVAPHHFRHAHAEHSLRGGATLMQVQRSLGHSDPRTTMRYVAPRPEDGCAWALGEL